MRAFSRLVPLVFAAPMMIGGNVHVAWAQGNVPIGMSSDCAPGGLITSAYDPSYWLAQHFSAGLSVAVGILVHLAIEQPMLRQLDGFALWRRSAPADERI